MSLFPQYRPRNRVKPTPPAPIPLNHVWVIAYNSGGDPATIADPLGNPTQFSYDDLDHLLQITDANGKLTKFTYDAMGNLLTVTDANSHKTSYTYDSRNRVIQREDALYHSDHYTYDHNSNLLTHTDRKNDVATFTYDALNRLATASYKLNGQSQPQDTITYAWDAGDRLTQAADAVAGTIVRTWDGLNRLTGEQTPLGEIAYGYDAAGRRATMQVVGQGQVAYAWDNADRLTGITQGGQSVGLSYDNASRRTQLTLPNGVTVAYSYDTDSRVTGLAYSANGTRLGNLTYAYDAAGRRTALGGSLAAVNLPANVAGGTGTAYNADNEPTKFNGVTRSGACPVRRRRNYNGNLTADGTNTYTWDARNHLGALAGGASASFVYDAFGRRMGKTINGATAQFLGACPPRKRRDGLNPAQELDGASPPNVTANLLTGLGLDEYFTRTDAGGTMAFMADALGSTVGLVNSAGGIDTSYAYQPFGATTVNGTSANPYQFTGRENDGTGLYYYRARYYSPTFQRFVSQDPIGFGGGDANLYAYVGNRSPNFSDPLGMQVFPGPIARHIGDQLDVSPFAPGIMLPNQPGPYCAQPPPPPPPPPKCPAAPIPNDWMSPIEANAALLAGVGYGLGGPWGLVGGTAIGTGIGLWVWYENLDCP